MAADADIHSDLDDYLTTKGVNKLFVRVVENMLVEKPDNPVRFIVRFLQREYPDQMSENYEGNGSVPDEIVRLESESDSDGGSESGSAGGGGEGGEERRDGKSAETVSQVQMASMLKELTAGSPPKSTEEEVRIMEFLRRAPICSQLEADQLRTIRDAVFPAEFAQGEYVVRQGDDGHHFYILDEGECHVIKDDEVVFEYRTPGDTFGELGLMHAHTRQASVVARSEGGVRLWALDRLTFKAVLMDAAIRKRALHRTFLRRVPLLETLSDYEMATVADALTETEHAHQEVVCRQGDPGDRFYIVKQGGAVVTQLDATGADVEVGRLAEGEFFGEIALMTSKPRQATVTAEGPLVTLSLDRRSFTRVLGSVVEILKGQTSRYEAFVALSG